ncbi:hypothetical protein AB0D46_16040 [Streptomyces sp. NPDC048383]|uniref:hypothetical protein n=1 Tax=Streptomyces sp. NPDC048383 TaxID=3155386 RepID=UPI00344443F7
MKRLIAALTSATALLLATPPPAAAAVNPAPCIAKSGSEATETREDSSVDDGEIRYTASSKYGDAIQYAVKAWQYSRSKIKVLPDSATTVNDLHFSDYSENRNTSANWTRNAAIGATDHIRFNTARMGQWSRTTQRWIAVHELGHALGLCHKSNGGASYVKSVMWTDPIEAGFADPQDVDKANYRKLWG